MPRTAISVTAVEARGGVEGVTVAAAAAAAAVAWGRNTDTVVWLDWIAQQGDLDAFRSEASRARVRTEGLVTQNVEKEGPKATF